MYPLGLSAKDRALFNLGLARPHSIRTRVSVLDMDHNLLGEAVGRVLTGQVDVDTGADITRSCGLTMLDPDHLLNLDSSAVFGGALFVDRMVRIHYGVRSSELDRWVDVPVFTGPINAMSRDGDVVTLSAVGKESLLMGPASTHRTWRAGSYKTTVLRELLGMFGEQFTEIPHQSVKTTKVLSVAPTTVPWQYITSVARSWGAGRIVYDGMGYARFVPPSSQPQWTFRGGAGGMLLSVPKIKYDMTGVRNFVVVTGAAPTQGGKPVVGLAHAPAAHPLSAVNMGRGGAVRYLREDVSDTSVTTVADANELAAQILKDRLSSGLQVDYTTMVVPHLEPHDVVTVEDGPWSATSSPSQFTIPLTADGTMSIGRNYTVTRHVRQRRTARTGPRKGAR